MSGRGSESAPAGECCRIGRAQTPRVASAAFACGADLD